MKKQKNWVEKHRPKNLEEVKGQSLAVQKIKEFLKNFPRKKSLMLHGPPGTGKTTLAYAAAKEQDAEIFELNASDLRNRKKLQAILKPAIEQRSLTKNKKIILVDEVDGISKVDWGGLPELLILLNKTRFPIILTANDVWNRNFSKLRSKSELVKLKEIDYKTIKDLLIAILRKEKKFIDNKILTEIAINAKGDLRAAINDLQTASSLEDPSVMFLDEREKESDIFNALKSIFKQMPTDKTMRIFDSVNLPLDEIMLWVEENIPLEYKDAELAKAYDKLSRADVFKGRIYKQQYWRFLVYENFFLSYGISASKKENKTGFTNYKRPTRILKIWLHNQRTAKKKSIAKKYAQYVHVGQKRALSEFPMLKNILKKPEVQKELKLTEEEIIYLAKN